MGRPHTADGIASGFPSPSTIDWRRFPHFPRGDASRKRSMPKRTAVAILREYGQTDFVGYNTPVRFGLQTETIIREGLDYVWTYHSM